jgi:GT2 family glycosyltransferase
VAVSVVVVSFRPEPWLPRCLESVTGQADEVIVVDNGSANARASEIGAHHGARVVRVAENTGFAGGANAGIAAAKSDHVALLNDDAFASPDWLAVAADVLADPTVAAAAPKLVLAWPYATVRLRDTVHHAPGDDRPLGRRITSVTAGGADAWPYLRGTGLYPDEGGWRWTNGDAVLRVPLLGNSEEVRVNGEPVAVEAVVQLVNNAGSFLGLDGAAGDIGYEEEDDGRFDTAADRFGACGAAMVVRSETWERLGTFAPNFFAYYEDTDWSWRAQLAGLRIRYDPAAVVRHVHAATSGEWSPRFSYLVARNRLLCLARNAPVRVVQRELARCRPLPPGVARSLARRLPQALLQRRRLARTWARSPAAVWDQWAGVDGRS